MAAVSRKKDIAFITFGRYQPPTLGHGIVFKEIARLAHEEDGDAYVFVGSNMALTWNKERRPENPLTVDEKLEILQHVYRKKLYGDHPITFVNRETCAPLHDKNTKCTQVYPMLDALVEKGYTDIRIFLGVDRVNTFTEQINKYKHSNKTKDVHIRVFPIGIDRSTSAIPNGAVANNTVSKISGTKIRKAARNNNKPLFMESTGLNDKIAAKYMQIITNRTQKTKPKSKEKPLIKPKNLTHKPLLVTNKKSSRNHLLHTQKRSSRSRSPHRK